MKLKSEVDETKLRGGFYTPDFIVDFCLERLTSLLGSSSVTTLLEPASGDGAFLRGLGRDRRLLASRAALSCVEIAPEVAARCRQALHSARLRGGVFEGSFFDWAAATNDSFDAVVGNPPYVRYQFVSAKDRASAEALLCRSGIYLQGVSNLWIPFVWASLDRLRPGGAFSLVLPNEIFGTVSGGQIRERLVCDFSLLQVDLFPRGAFPEILQDVVVVSGIRSNRTRAQRQVVFREHTNSTRSWRHTIPATDAPWTRYLLEPRPMEALYVASSLSGLRQLREVAQIGVSIVTGANDFFTVDTGTLKQWNLERWAVALLARTAESPGLIFRKSDHSTAERLGKKSWLLAFESDREDPMKFSKPREYLLAGRGDDLHTRFKCRIREPWYSVPNIVSGELMMAKRAHYHHRLILNRARVVTTDTIYKGSMQPAFKNRGPDLVAGFHNTLTLLTAEIEGRTYGGGVLELVPSELSRLVVPMFESNGALGELDAVSRSVGGQRDSSDTLVKATDRLLCDFIPDYKSVLEDLRDARLQLRQRRFQGNGFRDHGVQEGFDF